MKQITVGMKQITVGGCICNLHPIFYRYAASENAYVVDVKGNGIKTKLGDDGYHYVDLDWWGVRFRLQDFVWECFNCIIPSNCVVRNYTSHKLISCLKYLRLLKNYENNRSFKFHPFHDLYSTDHYGNIFDIMKRPCIKKMDDYGYYFVNLKCGPQIHKYPVHQFVWECFNGILPKNGMIEHFDGNKKNNCLHNLRLVLQNSQKQ